MFVLPYWSDLGSFEVVELMSARVGNDRLLAIHRVPSLLLLQGFIAEE